MPRPTGGSPKAARRLASSWRENCTTARSNNCLASAISSPSTGGAAMTGSRPYHKRSALKHAGGRHIHLSLLQSDEAIVLRVIDDGRGFEVPASLSQLAKDDHFGLIGIEEWAAWVGSLRSSHGRAAGPRSRFGGPGQQGSLPRPRRSSRLSRQRDYRLVHHYYDTLDSGTPKLQIHDLAGTSDGWPSVTEP